MNLKKVILFSLLVAGGTTAFAQNSNLRKAKTGLQEFQKLQGSNIAHEQLAQLGGKDLLSAKDDRDAEITHDKTKDNPETWIVYALIYSRLVNLEQSDEAEQTAEEGIRKAKELDSEEKNQENISIATQPL